MKKGGLVVTDNKKVKTSFLFANANQPEMSIDEQRVLLRVMEAAYNERKGLVIKENLCKTENRKTHIHLTMPVSYAFFSDIKPKDVEATLMRLGSRWFQWHYKERKEFYATQYIQDIIVRYGEGIMEFNVNCAFWNVLADFTEGYRAFELNKALGLPTQTAMRFYMLLCGKSQPLYFEVEDFRDWIGVPKDLYRDKNGKSRIDNLENRIIKPSKKALDASCPWTFTYEKVKVNPWSKTSSIKGFRFYAKEQPQFKDPNLERDDALVKLNPSMITGSYIYRFLKSEFGVTSEMLSEKGHKKNLAKWMKVETEPIAWLQSRIPHSKRSKKGSAIYILGAIKKRITDFEKSLGEPLPDVPEDDFGDTPY